MHAYGYIRLKAFEEGFNYLGPIRQPRQTNQLSIEVILMQIAMPGDLYTSGTPWTWLAWLYNEAPWAHVKIHI